MALRSSSTVIARPFSYTRQPAYGGTSVRQNQLNAILRVSKQTHSYARPQIAAPAPKGSTRPLPLAIHPRHRHIGIRIEKSRDGAGQPEALLLGQDLGVQDEPADDLPHGLVGLEPRPVPELIEVVLRLVEHGVPADGQGLLQRRALVLVERHAPVDEVLHLAGDVRVVELDRRHGRDRRGACGRVYGDGPRVGYVDVL